MHKEDAQTERNARSEEKRRFQLELETVKSNLQVCEPCMEASDG